MTHQQVWEESVRILQKKLVKCYLKRELRLRTTMEKLTGSVAVEDLRLYESLRKTIRESEQVIDSVFEQLKK